MPTPRAGVQMPPSRKDEAGSPSGDGGVSPPEHPEQPIAPVSNKTAQIRIRIPPGREESKEPAITLWLAGNGQGVSCSSGGAMGQ